MGELGFNPHSLSLGFFYLLLLLFMFVTVGMCSIFYILYSTRHSWNNHKKYINILGITIDTLIVVPELVGQSETSKNDQKLIIKEDWMDPSWPGIGKENNIIRHRTMGIPAGGSVMLSDSDILCINSKNGGHLCFYSVNPSSFTLTSLFLLSLLHRLQLLCIQ